MSTPLTFNLHPYTGIDPLSLEGLREHVIDPATNREYLLVAEPSVYPEPVPRALSEIMLGKLGVADFNHSQVEVFALPTDYVALGSVLNDAASSRSKRAQDFISGLFSEIGHSLRRIHGSSKLVPTDLSYKDIIVERDVANFKLLPPIEFIVMEEPTALRELGALMLDELRADSGNEQREQMVETAFNGFWASIEE